MASCAQLFLCVLGTKLCSESKLRAKSGQHPPVKLHKKDPGKPSHGSDENDCSFDSACLPFGKLMQHKRQSNKRCKEEHSLNFYPLAIQAPVLHTNLVAGLSLHNISCCRHRTGTSALTLEVKRCSFPLKLLPRPCVPTSLFIRAPKRSL